MDGGVDHRGGPFGATVRPTKGGDPHRAATSGRWCSSATRTSTTPRRSHSVPSSVTSRRGTRTRAIPRPPGFPQIHTVSPAAYDHRYGTKYRKKQSPNGPGWHADVTPLINPPSHSILRAEAVPPYGGDTQFVNVAAVYRALRVRPRIHRGAAGRTPFRGNVSADRSRRRSATWCAATRWPPSIRWSGCIRRPGTRAVRQPVASPARSSTCRRGRVGTSSTCCSRRSPGPSTRCGSSGRREASRSGTTARRCTLRPATSNMSTGTGYCTASRWSVTFRSDPTAANPSRWRAISSGPA